MSISYEIKKYDYLDWLRGFAILGTIFAHISAMQMNFINYLNENIFPFIIPFGAMCVPLFFIVSAYTLALSYNSRTQKENYPTKKFFMRRFFRIYPLFFTMSIFLFLLYNSPIVIFAENTTIDTSIGNLIKHLTFTYGFSLESLGSLGMGEWSLFSEAIFYLIFPILFLIIKNNTKLLTLLIFSLIIFIFITSYNNKLYNIPLVSMYSFMLGLTLFKVKNYTISPYKLKYLAIFNLLLYIILPPITLYIKQNFIDLSFQVLYPIMFLNLSLTTFLFIKGKYDIKNKILIKFFKFTGQISYSLYLQNMLFLTGFGHIFNKFIFNVYQHNLFIEIILFLLTIGMLFTTSFLTYKFIEQPGIKLGKKIIEKNLN